MCCVLCAVCVCVALCVCAVCRVLCAVFCVLCAVCCGQGEVYIWDTHKGRPLVKAHFHQKASYRVYWSPLEAGLIASSSLDCSVVIMDDKGTLVHR